MQRVQLLFVSILALGVMSPMLVQAKDLELTAFGGYNLGGSIDVRENQTYKINTKDSYSAGAALTWQRSDSHAFELFWNYRPTHITGKRPGETQESDLVDLDAHDFMANFLFMPAYRESKFTPFLLVGLGATLLDPGEVAGLSPDSKTKFSWNLGAGFKTMGAGRLGIRAQARYHSTYISDESNGTWCDPYYGCYETVATNWLDEWDFDGGLIIKLGEGP
jgi:opacity protein-like surface antigen